MSRSSKGLYIFLSLILVLSLLLTGCEAAAAKKTVKIAFIGPFTGGNAAMGLGGRNSFKLAIDELNAVTTNKYNYEVVYIDDECKPDVGVQAALKAGSDPAVIAAASHYCSMVAVSTADTFHQQGLPSMVWGAVLPSITYGNNYVEITRVNGTQIQQNQVNAQLIWDLGFRKVSIIHDTSDYGRGHTEYFTAAWKKLGGTILSTQGVTTDQQDFTVELTKVKAEKPEVLYFGGLTPLGIALRTAMVKLGVEAQFDGTSGILNQSFNDSLAANAEGTLGFVEGAPIADLPGGKKFLEAYEKAGFKEAPEAYGAFAYVAGKLIVAAIEKVGPDRVKVAEELAKTKDVETIIGKVTFDEAGQNIVPLITAYVSQDGKWVSWATSEYKSGKRKLPGLKFMGK